MTFSRALSAITKPRKCGQSIASVARRIHTAASLAFMVMIAAMMWGQGSALGANVFGRMTNGATGLPDTNYIKLVRVAPLIGADGSFLTRGLPFRVYPDTNGFWEITNMVPGCWLATNQFIVDNWYGPGGFSSSSGYFFAVDITTNTYSWTKYPRNGPNILNWMLGIPGIVGTNGFVVTVDPETGIVTLDGAGLTPAVTSATVTNALGFLPANAQVAITNIIYTNSLILVPVVGNTLFINTNTDQLGAAAAVQAALNITNAATLATVTNLNQGALTAAANLNAAQLAALVATNNSILLTATNLSAAERQALLQTNLATLLTATNLQFAALQLATNLVNAERAALIATNSATLATITNLNQAALNSATNTAAAERAALSITNAATLLTVTNLNQGALNTATNLSAAQLAALIGTNSALLNWINFQQARIGAYTNWLILSGAGTSAANGTNIWSGFAWTNNSAASWVTNIGATYFDVVSGISAYSAPYPTGPWTATGGSSPVPLSGFATNGLVAGANVVITRTGNTLTISATGGGGSGTNASSVAAGSNMTVTTNGTVYTVSVSAGAFDAAGSAAAVQTFANSATTAISNVLAGVITFANSSSAAISNNLTALSSFTLTATGSLSNQVATAQSFANSSSTALSNLVATVQTFANSATTAISNQVATLNSFTTTATGSLSNQVSTIGGFANSSSTAISNILTALNGFVNSSTTAISNNQAALSSFTTTATGSLSNQVATINGFLNSSTTAISNNAATLSSFTTGATSSLSNQVSAVSSFLNSATTALTNNLAANGVSSTNFSLTVGQANTNLSLTVGAAGTNNTALQGAANTNFSLTVGQANTNLSLTIGAAGSNNVANLAAITVNFNNGITNLSIGTNTPIMYMTQSNLVVTGGETGTAGTYGQLLPTLWTNWGVGETVTNQNAGGAGVYAFFNAAGSERYLLVGDVQGGVWNLINATGIFPQARWGATIDFKASGVSPINIPSSAIQNLTPSAVTSGGGLLAGVPANALSAANRDAIMDAVYQPYSTSLAPPLTSQYCLSAQGTWPVVSVVSTPNGYLVNQESNQSFTAIPIHIPPVCTNVNLSFYAFAPAAMTLDVFQGTNLNGNDNPHVPSFSLGTTPQLFTANFGYSNSDMLFQLYPASPYPYTISNLLIVCTPTTTDPVLSQPFHNYDVQKSYQNNSAWLASTPQFVSEGTTYSFFTDAKNVTLFIGGQIGGFVNLVAQVYTNSSSAPAATYAVTGTTAAGGLIQYYPLVLPGGVMQRVDVVSSPAIQPNGGSIPLPPNNRNFIDWGNNSWLEASLLNVAVPATNTLYFETHYEQMRRFFVYGDSIMYCGGAFANFTDNSLWPELDRLLGCTHVMYAAGDWSLHINYLASRAQFWTAVRQAQFTDFFCNMGINDYNNATATNEFATNLLEMVQGVHVTHPAAAIWLMGLTRSTEDSTANSIGLEPHDYTFVISNVANTFPAYCVYVTNNLTTADLADPYHPTAAGNAKMAVSLRPQLETFPGSGSGLTSLNASALTSGTVPLARLAGITSNQLDATTWQLATNAPLATTSAPGIMQVGSGLAVTGGVVSATGGGTAVNAPLVNSWNGITSGINGSPTYIPVAAGNGSANLNDWWIDAVPTGSQITVSNLCVNVANGAAGTYYFELYTNGVPTGLKVSCAFVSPQLNVAFGGGLNITIPRGTGLSLYCTNSTGSNQSISGGSWLQ